MEDRRKPYQAAKETLENTVIRVASPITLSPQETVARDIPTLPKTIHVVLMIEAAEPVSP